MSSTNKITGVENKILDRSTKDDDISSGHDDGDDSINNQLMKIAKEIKIAQKRLLWFLLGFGLLFCGYCLWRIPVKMKVIAVIPNEYELDRVHWNALGLIRWSFPYKSPAPSVISQYGWDGKLIWSAKGPSEVYKFDLQQMASSPDGHVIAITFLAHSKMYVMGWRDGRFLGKISYNDECEHIHYSDGINLYATNSGRIWTHNINRMFSIKAIDGNNLAIGRLEIPPYNDVNAHSCFIPDDSVIAVQKDSKAGSKVCYLMLAVKKHRVIVKQEIIHKGVSIYSYDNRWNDETCYEPGFEIDNNNNYVSKYTGTWVNLLKKREYDGFLDGTNHSLWYSELSTYHNNYLSFIKIPSGKKWIFTTSLPHYSIACGSPNGNNVLIYEEDGQIPGYILTLSIILSKTFVENLIGDFYNYYCQNYYREQISLYSYPGVQKAYFPKKFNYADFGYCEVQNGFDFSVSPDGHKIGARFTSKEKSYYMILGW